MAEKTRRINLLPNKGETVLNQFLSWALNVGRLLVIITETLALSVFFYRFTLDMRIIDLHDKIKTESIIVQNFQDGEKNFRNLQARLASIKKYDNTKNLTLTILNDIVNLGRNKVTFRNIIVTNDSIEIEAQAPSATALSSFTQALKNYQEIRSVSINRVENKTSNATITVDISAVLKRAKPSPTPTMRGGAQ